MLLLPSDGNADGEKAPAARKCSLADHYAARCGQWCRKRRFDHIASPHGLNAGEFTQAERTPSASD